MCEEVLLDKPGLILTSSSVGVAVGDQIRVGGVAKGECKDYELRLLMIINCTPLPPTNRSNLSVNVAG